MLIGARGAGKGATIIVEKFRGLIPMLPIYSYTLFEDIISSFTNSDFPVPTYLPGFDPQEVFSLSVHRSSCAHAHRIFRKILSLQVILTRFLTCHLLRAQETGTCLRFEPVFYRAGSLRHWISPNHAIILPQQGKCLYCTTYILRYKY